MHLIKSPELKDDTKVYRYLKFCHFLDFVETKQTSLTRVKGWEDTWEIPAAKLPLQLGDGRVQFGWNHCESMFGQCWSLLHESDAMWRIYSPHHDGVVIQSSIRKFSLMAGITIAAIGPIVYYNDLKAALDKIDASRQGEYMRFAEGLLKRKAFEHEAEVRFLTKDDSDCLALEIPKGAKRFYADLDPLQFIEGITIDPRANDRHVEAVKKYCERSGFNFQPVKSPLYGNPYETTRLVRRYLPVKK